MPQRVGGKEGREEDGNGGRIERVGGHRVFPCRFALAHDQKRRGPDHANGDADRRCEPAVLDRIAEEKDGGEHERDARDGRE